MCMKGVVMGVGFLVINICIVVIVGVEVFFLYGCNRFGL